MWQEHEFWCHDVRGVCERRIPFIIHQMYKNEALPEEWANTPSTWQRMNPGYKYMLWTDHELQELIANHYAWFLPVYLSYPHNIQRSDSSRYFLLHRYGGIYADLDIVSTRSIDRLIAGHEALLPLTPNIGITNAVMASTPGHEFFAFAIKELERYSQTWYHGTRHVTIVSSTGPTFLWSAFLHYRGTNSVALVPAAVWGKCTVCHPLCAEMAGAFFRHLSGGSWHTGDSKAINNALICHPILLAIGSTLALSAVRMRVMWVPLIAVASAYLFQDWLDIDMWFAPVAWLMGRGKHGSAAAPKLLPGEQPGAEALLDAKAAAANDLSRDPTV
ncbi:nucleotide-diphospho-sugar transferase [Pavlovales sp. CCMP2436]|nr:nucleotide-diphospho-sugar transferase [Pavlovales sp. CCMP2436]